MQVIMLNLAMLSKFFLVLITIHIPNLVYAKCYTESRIVGITYFHDDSRPPRLELWSLDDDLLFKTSDECQARLVLWHMKDAKNASELVKDPTTNRIVYITKNNDTDWLKETAYMCSLGRLYCE